MCLPEFYWDPGLFGAVLLWPLNPLKWMSLSEGTWLAPVKLSPKSMHFLAQRAKTANISGLPAGVWHCVTGTKDAQWEAWCPAPDLAPQASWMPPKVAPPRLHHQSSSPAVSLHFCSSTWSHTYKAVTSPPTSLEPPPPPSQHAGITHHQTASLHQTFAQARHLSALLLQTCVFNLLTIKLVYR